MKFKVGDRVRCIASCKGDFEKIGLTGHITAIGSVVSQHPYWVSFSCTWFADFELELIEEESEKKEVSKNKYYRVVKDTPIWAAGAILKKDYDAYSPIEDYWNQIEEITTDLGEHESVVENAPEWFERVYEVSALGKLVYVTKEEAKRQASKLFKLPKNKEAK